MGYISKWVSHLCRGSEANDVGLVYLQRYDIPFTCPLIITVFHIMLLPKYKRI